MTDTLKAGGTSYALTQYNYDTKGRLDCAAVRMNGAVFGSLPDACSLSTQGTAGPDRITKTTYDAADEVTKVTSGLGSAVPADDARYTYRDNGQVETLTDANGNRTTYVYDGLDRLSQTRYPSATSVGTSSTTDYEGLSYDPNGNVTQQRLRDGKLIDYTYDALDRATVKDVPTGPGENPNEHDVGFTYDNLGRILELTGSTPTSLTYDGLGRVTSETTAALTKSMGYDLAGSMTHLTYPDGFFVTYDRLITGEVTAIRENGAASGVGVLGTYTYDGLGRLTSLARGNGVVTSYAFDAVSRLASLSHGPGTAAVKTDFTYNPASQIASRARDNDAYSWASARNAPLAYQVNGLNQYTAAGTTALGYDGRGNLTSSGSTAYGYTSENRLVSGPGVTFDYDLAGRLRQTTGTTTTRFDYLGLDLLTELDTNGGILRRYVHGPGIDSPLVQYEGSGTDNRRWLIPDERGSVVAMTDASGQSIAINTYDEYGVPGTGNKGRFQYTGQKWIAELGLYDYKARMYSPTIGRFLQPDPIGYGDGPHMYNYVGGDPINTTDPSGLQYVPGVGLDGTGGGGGGIVVTGHRSSAPSFGGGFGFAFPSIPSFGGFGALDGSGILAPNEPTITVTAQVKPKPSPRPGSLPQNDITVTAKKYAKKLGQCAADQFGLTALGGALAGAGANVIGTGGKFAGATPGTSLASRAAGAIFGGLELPRALPTLTGFPGIGNGLKLTSTLSAARFAGRAVPVVGYALLAYDAYEIGKCVAQGD